MVSTEENPSLGEAAGYFLSDLAPEESGVSRQEVNKFVRWFGRERPFTGLTASEIDNFAEHFSRSDTDYLSKLALIRAFLIYAKKKRWSKTNLATHLKARKGKTKPIASARGAVMEAVSITRQGQAELEAELTILQDERYQAIDEITRAAADKDFRENAPLDAAKERRGWIEGRIMELEGILKAAVIVDEQRASLKVGIGDSVVLCELNSAEEMRYTLVSPKEVNVTKGKISGASPMGKAVIGKEQGETVEIIAPAGKLLYRIERIER
ncbi:MAG: transcription elongation factor GreA [Dehalococcoidales bacterium]